MKKIILFVFVQLVLVSLLIGGLIGYESFTNAERAHDVTITIKGVDPVTNDLIMDPPANNEVPVYKRQLVTWHIDPSSNLQYIRIKKKDTSDGIFDELKPLADGRWQGHVGFFNTTDKVYSYNIFWKLRTGTREITFDPKLAVRSESKKLVEWLMYILYAGLFLLSFKILRKA